jgi:hypothetical protein
MVKLLGFKKLLAVLIAAVLVSSLPFVDIAKARTPIFITTLDVSQVQHESSGANVLANVSINYDFWQVTSFDIKITLYVDGVPTASGWNEAETYRDLNYRTITTSYALTLTEGEHQIEAKGNVTGTNGDSIWEDLDSGIQTFNVNAPLTPQPTQTRATPQQPNMSTLTITVLITAIIIVAILVVFTTIILYKKQKDTPKKGGIQES